ncbi:hypothetical protein ACDB75_004328 [Salmonella enterica]
MKFGGHCAYCGCELPENCWHADHTNPVVRKYREDERPRASGKWKLMAIGKCHYSDNDNAENMMSNCAYCTINKSSLNIDEFRKFIATRPDMLMETTSGNMSVKYNLIKLTPKDTEFCFEKYQEKNI